MDIVERLRKRQGSYMGMAMDADIKEAADIIEQQAATIETCFRILKANSLKIVSNGP